MEDIQAFPDDYVEDVLQRMTDHAVSVLPVNDPETGAFVGSIANHEVVEMIVLTAQGHEV